MADSPSVNVHTAMAGGRLLDDFSVEITAHHGEKVDLLRGRLRAGSRVFIALIAPGDARAQIDTARRLARAGFRPVPHLPARLVPSREALNERLEQLTCEAGVEEVLAIGGGLETQGPFPATIDLLRTGLIEAHGIRRVGFAGHPEGNPDITRAEGEEALLEALLAKQAYARENGLEAYLLTQFLFEAEAVAGWLAEIRRQGVELPLHVGVPGPATIKTLAKYALLCGIGASARMIRKQALNVSRLMSVSAPDELVDALERLKRASPQLGIEGVHFYPFGGFDRLFDWLAKRR